MLDSSLTKERKYMETPENSDCQSNLLVSVEPMPQLSSRSNVNEIDGGDGGDGGGDGDGSGGTGDS